MEKQLNLSQIFLHHISFLEKEGRFATARNYRKTLNSIQTFMEGEEIPLNQINARWVNAYNSYLYSRKASRNSVSFYNRVLRAHYNKVIGTVKNDPFKGAFTGVSPTRKRALPPSVIKRIADLELDGEMALSRDLFLFSFYARGMCYVDMAKLRRPSLCGDYLSYRRSKTGQELSLQLEPCMMEIIDRWSGQAYGDYVFPILHSDIPRDAFREYSYRIARHNLMLKEIGRLAHAPFPLNSYAARHSWATIANRLDVPVAVISSGMGHTSERTTRIYLSQLENSVLDRANKKVIRAVLK